VSLATLALYTTIAIVIAGLLWCLGDQAETIKHLKAQLRLRGASPAQELTVEIKCDATQALASIERVEKAAKRAFDQMEALSAARVGGYQPKRRGMEQGPPPPRYP
jgi:hypothetical protein